MSDLLVLVVLVVLPAAITLGPLAILTLGIAAVSDLDGGLVRSPGPRDGRPQPAPASSSVGMPPDGALASGPAVRIASVTPSA